MDYVPRILVVEDDLTLKPFWEVFFGRSLLRFHLDWAVSGEEARRLVADANQPNESGDRGTYDLIVADLFLSGAETGLDLLDSVEVKQSGASVVLVSAVKADRIRQSYEGLISSRVILSKPLKFATCERLMAGPLLRTQSRLGVN